VTFQKIYITSSLIYNREVMILIQQFLIYPKAFKICLALLVIIFKLINPNFKRIIK